MEMPTTIDIELLAPGAHQGSGRLCPATQVGRLSPMVTPKHIVEITGWSRTFTYEQLRPQPGWPIWRNAGDEASSCHVTLFAACSRARRWNNDAVGDRSLAPC